MENWRQKEFVKAMHRQPLGRSKQKSEEKEEAKSSQKALSDSSSEDPLNIATRPKSPNATLEARKPFKNPMKAIQGREKRDESKGVVSKRLTRKQAMEEDTRRRAQTTHRLTIFSSGKPKYLGPIEESKSSSSQAPAAKIARPNSSYAADSRADRADEDASSSSKQSAFPNVDDSEQHSRTRPDSPSTAPKPFPMDEDEDAPLLSRGTSSPPATKPAAASLVPRTPSPLRRKAPEEPQPFPMSPTTPMDSTRTVKRGSSSGLINDAVSFKRPKYDEGSGELQDDSIIHEAEFERDRLMMEPVDPKSLCAFCDEPWPKDPSKELMDLFARIRPRAWPHPRYRNACGLQAPVEVFVDVCNMHRNETTIIPEGLAQGWPSQIDFDAMPQRLWKLKSKLENIIKSPAGGYFYEIAVTDIKEMGGLVMGGVRGQFAAFQKTQPGYYGERGLLRIYQVLRDLFPLLAHERSFMPLDHEGFVMRVLVPEAACLLIQEDLQLSSHAEALDILQRSQKYGLAKFPDRGEEDGIGMEKLGVGMRIRLKLGQERMEADLAQAHKEVDDERKAKAKNKRLVKDKDIDTDTDAGRKPKRKGKAKEKAKERPRGSVTTGSSDQASSLIDLSSDAEVCSTSNDSDPDVTILGGDTSTTPTTKRRSVKVRKRGNPSASETSIDVDLKSKTSQLTSRRRLKKREPTSHHTPPYGLRSRSTSVTTITTSDPAQKVDWTTNLRDNDDPDDTESSQEL